MIQNVFLPDWEFRKILVDNLQLQYQNDFSICFENFI